MIEHLIEASIRNRFLVFIATGLLAVAQRLCPVMDDSRLGSMDVPVKVMIDGQAVFLCCEGCKDVAMEKPKETLARVKQFLKTKAAPTVEPTP